MSYCYVARNYLFTEILTLTLQHTHFSEPNNHIYSHQQVLLLTVLLLDVFILFFLQVFADLFRKGCWKITFLAQTLWHTSCRDLNLSIFLPNQAPQQDEYHFWRRDSFKMTFLYKMTSLKTTILTEKLTNICVDHYWNLLWNCAFRSLTWPDITDLLNLLSIMMWLRVCQRDNEPLLQRNLHLQDDTDGQTPVDSDFCIVIWNSISRNIICKQIETLWILSYSECHSSSWWTFSGSHKHLFTAVKLINVWMSFIKQQNKVSVIYCKERYTMHFVLLVKLFYILTF